MPGRVWWMCFFFEYIFFIRFHNYPPFYLLFKYVNPRRCSLIALWLLQSIQITSKQSGLLYSRLIQWSVLYSNRRPHSGQQPSFSINISIAFSNIWAGLKFKGKPLSLWLCRVLWLHLSSLWISVAKSLSCVARFTVPSLKTIPSFFLWNGDGWSRTIDKGSGVPC